MAECLHNKNLEDNAFTDRSAKIQRKQQVINKH